MAVWCLCGVCLSVSCLCLKGNGGGKKKKERKKKNIKKLKKEARKEGVASKRELSRTLWMSANQMELTSKMSKMSTSDPFP